MSTELRRAAAAAEPVVVLVYDGVAADEAGIVVDLLGRAGLNVVIASVAATSITSYHGRVIPERRAVDLGSVGALVIPGGMGVQRALTDEELVRAIATLGGSARIIAATSTGSVLLAAAGLARGRRLTTHWLARDLFDADDEVELVDGVFVEDGPLLTASGVASTVQLSLRIIERTVGAEAAARVRPSDQPSPTRDGRYRSRRSWRQRPWWQRLRDRRTPVAVNDMTGEIDPDGVAEFIVLELD